MLGDLDLSKPIQRPELFICKPDGATIGKLNEAFNIVFKLKLGITNELSFDVPYEVVKGHQFVTNPNISKLKDRYLIRYVNGNYQEMFVIYHPTTTVDTDKNFKSFDCFSLEYELRGNPIVSYKTTHYLEDGTSIDYPKNATSVLIDALSGTLWNVGYVDSAFDVLYRSFDESRTNSLDMIYSIGTTFQGLIVADTLKREISLWNPDKIGTNKGLTLSMGNLSKSMKHEKQHDNFCTQLRVIGKDGVSINSVNPTGTDYLEDFSYYLYPYQEDENGNVISRSDYMSDELCHAILEYDKKVASKQGVYKGYLSQLATLQSTLDTQNNDADALQTTINTLTDEKNVKQSAGQDASSLISQINTTQTQLNAKKADIDSTNSQINGVYAQIQSLQDDLAIENNFTAKQIKERTQFINGAIFEETRASTPQELYDAAVTKFETLKKPQTIVNVDLVLFTEIVSQQRKFSKLNLGDIVTIYYPEFDTNVQAKIVEIDFQFENDTVNLTIANFEEIMDDHQRLIDMVYKAAGSSGVIDSSKSKWDGVEVTDNKVEQILQNAWDGIKRGLTGGTNESVIIDRNGITDRDMNDPSRFIRINHGALGFTMDDGNTFSVAIDATGVYADKLVGRIIMGEKLILTSSDGIFEIVNNCLTVYDKDENAVMKIGEYDSTSGAEKFGMELINGTNRVIVDKDSGFKITKRDGENWDSVAWLDLNGDLHLQDIYATGVIDATSFSIKGVSFLTSDGLFLDGAHIKHIIADTIDSGTLNANIVTIKSTQTDGGYIIEDGNGIRGYDGTGKLVFNIGTDGNSWFGGTITGALIRTDVSGHARIEMKNDSFYSYNESDELSGFCLNVDAEYGTFVSLYRQGVEYVSFVDEADCYRLTGTKDASRFIIGGDSCPTDAEGIWNFRNGFNLLDWAGDIKASFSLSDGGSYNSYPILTLGLGTGANGLGQAQIFKHQTGLQINYQPSSGVDPVQLSLNDDGSVMIMSSSHSYIQLANGGDINISAIGNVNITGTKINLN